MNVALSTINNNLSIAESDEVNMPTLQAQYLDMKFNDNQMSNAAAAAGSPNESFEVRMGSGSTSKLNKKCAVCDDSATGTYFGANVCVPCKVTALNYGNIVVLLYSCTVVQLYCCTVVLLYCLYCCTFVLFVMLYCCTVCNVVMLSCTVRAIITSDDDMECK